jgi:hypothetical protein
MVDSVQRQSTVPVPAFQTEQGAHNPLPLNAPKEENRLEDAAKAASRESSADRFEDYLNKSETTLLEKARDKGLTFDPAAEISAASVYSQPGAKLPF